MSETRTGKRLLSMARRKQSNGLLLYLVGGIFTTQLWLTVKMLEWSLILTVWCFQLSWALVCKILRRRAPALPSSHPERSRYISVAVKNTVFRRDRGTCVACGNTHSLEYDHAIPFSLGGGNNADNIQLLCTPCNRAKSAKAWKGPTL